MGATSGTTIKMMPIRANILGGFASGIIIAHHCADDDHSHARTECLHDAQVEELFGTRNKYDGGNGKAIYNQTGQGDGFAPFDVGHRTADHLSERRAEHKQTQTLFDAVNIRVQRLRHFGNRGQVGIDGKRHQRNQHRHQNRHQFFAHFRIMGRRHKFSSDSQTNRPAAENTIRGNGKF